MASQLAMRQYKAEMYRMSSGMRDAGRDIGHPACSMRQKSLTGAGLACYIEREIKCDRKSHHVPDHPARDR